MKLLTRNEAADMLGFAPNTLAQWAMTGKNLAVIRIGRAVRYSLQDVEDFIERCRYPSSSGHGDTTCGPETGYADQESAFEN